MLAATVSDAALRKLNPYHDALGRFTFAPGSPVSYGKPSDAKKPVGRWGGQDPGAISVTLKNGKTVKGANDKPLLMPKGVSLADNVKQGEKLRAMPSVFTPGFFLPRYDTIFPPVKEGAMIYWFAPGQPMDYQRTRSSTDKINKAYIDFGNYNYGVVAAAAGYDVDQALFSAGVLNFLGGGDHSGEMNNNPRNVLWIRMGYSDYKKGLIIKTAY